MEEHFKWSKIPQYRRYSSITQYNPKKYSPRQSTIRQYSSIRQHNPIRQSTPIRQYSSIRQHNPIRQSVPIGQSVPIRQQPRRGLPLGHAFTSSGTMRPGTGIVPGSSIASLQQAYRTIYTPRPTSQISGQQTRQQHLFGSSSSSSYPYPGLGTSGWVSWNQQSPFSQSSSSVRRGYP